MSQPNFQKLGGRWQYQLEDYCRRHKLQPPTFNLWSDRRGGRTAWTSKVNIQGRTFAARYWYDGDHVNNAREDAAEVALIVLAPNSHKAGASKSHLGQLWPQQP